MYSKVSVEKEKENSSLRSQLCKARVFYLQLSEFIPFFKKCYQNPKQGAHMISFNYTFLSPSWRKTNFGSCPIIFILYFY